MLTNLGNGVHYESDSKELRVFRAFPRKLVECVTFDPFKIEGYASNVFQNKKGNYMLRSSLFAHRGLTLHECYDYAQFIRNAQNRFIKHLWKQADAPCPGE